MAKSYHKAAELFPEQMFLEAMDYLSKADKPWRGGVVYFPSVTDSRSGWLTEKSQRFQKALAVVAVVDGYTHTEAAVMAGVSVRTVASWNKKYGDTVRKTLRSIRKES